MFEILVLGLTHSLQAEAKDIVQAVSEINHVKATLLDVRDNINKYHEEQFAIVTNMCDSVHVQPSLSRLCGHQRHRANVPVQISI